MSFLLVRFLWTSKENFVQECIYAAIAWKRKSSEPACRRGSLLIIYCLYIVAPVHPCTRDIQPPRMAEMSELQEPFPTVHPVHPVHPVHKKPGNARFIQIASIAILIYDPSEVVFSASTSLAGLSISSTIAMGALSPVL